MNKGNLISKQIPAAIMQQALQKINELNTLLAPYYSNLPTEDKRDFPIVSDERLPFATKGIDFTSTDQVYLPQDCSAQELNNDYSLFNDTRKLLIPLQQIRGGLLNTNNLAGSDVFVTLLDYYMIVQRKSEKGDARAKVIFEELKKVFSKGKKAVKNVEVSAN